ncbi:14935_t:CDS:2, partial [Acaulospora morrowiae]
MSESSYFANNMNPKLSNTCANCIKHKKGCNACPRCIKQGKRPCSHIEPGTFKCENCMKGNGKECFFQCEDCYKKNKHVERGQPFPKCNNCKIVTEGPPIDFDIFKEDGKVYLCPIGSKDQRFEVSDEIFEKVFELKYGCNPGRYMRYFLDYVENFESLV